MHKKKSLKNHLSEKVKSYHATLKKKSKLLHLIKLKRVNWVCAPKGEPRTWRTYVLFGSYGKAHKPRHSQMDGSTWLGPRHGA